MNYTIEIADAAKHFIKVTTEINCLPNGELRLQLPSWRPGRYQLANYAKNIRKFNVLGADYKKIEYRKLTKDCWLIHTENYTTIWVEYEYYANQFDAGACYADNNVLYVNPVNCLLFNPEYIKQTHTVTLKIPNNYKVACQLPVINNTLQTNDFHTLADSPFIAAAGLKHHSFLYHDSVIHFWFYGNTPFNDYYIKKLEHDTITYAGFQTKIFGEFPCPEYHFIYCFLPYKFRHGVEHENSTVIVMGFTEDDLLDEFYDDLLAISCHELFHLWNVKRLRPADMYPYDYSKENYSTLGYIYEGITTYYGDLALLRSKIWDLEKYLASFEGYLTRHIANSGRFNYSLAQSSFDTWLDGYETGVEGRKISIYTEGCIAAFIADIMILEATNGKKRLDDVMYFLYQNTYKKHCGYTEADYRYALETISGISFENYFQHLIHGCGYWDKYLNDYLSKIGFTIKIRVNFTIKLLDLDEINKIQLNLKKVWMEAE